MFHIQYLGAVEDGVDAVSDCEGRTAGEVCTDGALDKCVGLAVHTGRRLIGDQHLPSYQGEVSICMAQTAGYVKQ